MPVDEGDHVGVPSAVELNVKFGVVPESIDVEPFLVVIADAYVPVDEVFVKPLNSTDTAVDDAMYSDVNDRVRVVPDKATCVDASVWVPCEVL